MLQVPDLSDRCHAANVDTAQLARRHAHHRVVALLGKELRRRSCRADKLPPSPQRQLDVVDGRADRDPGQGQSVADSDGRLRAAHQPIAHLEPEGGEDVPLLPISVGDQRDARSTIRIVLDAGHRARHTELVTLEVDLAINTPPATATVTHRDPSLIVATGSPGQLLQQALLRLRARDLLEAGRGHEAAPWAGRLVFANWHPTPLRTALPACRRTTSQWLSSSLGSAVQSAHGRHAEPCHEPEPCSHWPPSPLEPCNAPPAPWRSLAWWHRSLPGRCSDPAERGHRNAR